MAADFHHLPRNLRRKEFPSKNHNNSGSNTKAESKSLPEKKKNIDPKWKGQLMCEDLFLEKMIWFVESIQNAAHWQLKPI